MRFPRTLTEGALCGIVVGAVLALVFHWVYGEAPPLWLTLVGTAIIVLPLAIFGAAKRQPDVPRETKEN